MQDAAPIIESEFVHYSKPASRRRVTNEDIASSRRVRSSLQRTRHTTRYPTSSTPLQAVTKNESKRRSDSGHGKLYPGSLLPSLVESSTECGPLGPVVSECQSPESIGSGPPPGFATPKSSSNSDQPVLSEPGAAELDPKLLTPERSNGTVPVVDGSVAMAECPLPLSTESLPAKLADSRVSSNSSLPIDDSVMSGRSTPGGDSKSAEELNRGRKFSPPVGSNGVASEFPPSRSGPSRAESDLMASNSFRDQSGSFNIPPPGISSTGPSSDELNHRKKFSPSVTLNPSLPVGEPTAEYKPPRDSNSRTSQAERDLKPNGRYSIGVPPSSFRVGSSNHHQPSVPSAPTVRISPPLSKAIRVVRSECPRPISFPTPIISSSSSRTLPPLTRSESYPTQLEPLVPSSPRPTHSPPSSRQCIVDLSDLLQEFDEKLRTTRQNIRSEQQRSASRTLSDATARSDLQSEWENQRTSKSITADWLYEHALKCLELETKQDPIVVGSVEFYGTESMGLDEDSQRRNDRSDHEPNGTSPPEIDGNETRKGFGCARVMRTGFWKSVLPCVR